MFKSIRLKNFKSYKDSGDVPLAPLTVLVGLNNSGKSALLHAILALKQAAQVALDSGSPSRPAFVSFGTFVNLNGFYDILHKPKSEESFSISLERDQAETQHFIFRDQPDDQQITSVPIANKLEVSFCLGNESKEIEVSTSRLSLDGKTILEYQKNGQATWSSDELPFGRDSAAVFLRGFTPFLGPLPTAKPNPATVDFFTALNAASVHGYLWLKWLAERVQRVGAIRTRVPWSTSVGVRTPPEFGLGGENLLAALGNEERRFPKNRTLLEHVNSWLAENRILNKLHVATDNSRNVRMLYGDEVTGLRDINVAGMGEGISQVLPIIALGLSVSPQQCLLVEQPEIHLHPALQADLADLFINVTSEGDRQVIAETHSEHFVLRLRRRIAEGLDPKNVRILFVEKTGADSIVRPLDVSDRGTVTNWPDGFFDEAYTEAMAMVEAAARRS